MGDHLVEIVIGRRLLDLDISAAACRSTGAPCARPRRAARTTRRPSRRRAAARSRGRAVLLGEGPDRQHVSGRLMPLRLASKPPTSTVASMVVAVFSNTVMRICHRRAAECDRAPPPPKICGMRRNARSGPPAIPLIEADGAFGDRTRSPSMVPMRKLGPLQVGQDADRPAELGFSAVAHGPVHFLHALGVACSC